MILNKLCHTHIKDSFWYGTIGSDFNLVIDKSTGYFNATKLCRDTGKDINHWKRVKQTKELIAYIKTRGGTDIYEPKGLSNYQKDDKQITGTYLPQDLFLPLAMWISTDFYCKCVHIILGLSE